MLQIVVYDGATARAWPPPDRGRPGAGDATLKPRVGAKAIDTLIADHGAAISAQPVVRASAGIRARYAARRVVMLRGKRLIPAW